MAAGASAVLVLFGRGRVGRTRTSCYCSVPPTCAITQVSQLLPFPGGAADPGETDDPIVTALREANEEVGLDPASVDVELTMPPLWIPVSNYLVTPVLAWWREPHPVSPWSTRPRWPASRASAFRELVDPANRVRRLASEWMDRSGVPGRRMSMLIWGFTAGIVSVLLDMGGWTQPWTKTAARRSPGGLKEMPTGDFKRYYVNTSRRRPSRVCTVR